MTTRSATAALVLFFASLAPLTAADTKLEIQPEDMMQTLIARQVGQMVEFRLKSGEKIGGKVEKVTNHLVQLSQLTGAEFYDAVVSMSDISAVVVRSKK